jgi:hypothetical protein
VFRLKAQIVIDRPDVGGRLRSASSDRAVRLVVDVTDLNPDHGRFGRSIREDGVHRFSGDDVAHFGALAIEHGTLILRTPLTEQRPDHFAESAIVGVSRAML